MHRLVFFFEVIPRIFTYTSSCFPILPTWFKSYWIGDIWSPKSRNSESLSEGLSGRFSGDSDDHSFNEGIPTLTFIFRCFCSQADGTIYTASSYALVMWYLPIIFHIPSNVQVAKCFCTPLWKRKFDVETSTPCFKTVGNVLLWHLGVGGNGETERVLPPHEVVKFPIVSLPVFLSRMECNNLGDP